MKCSTSITLIQVADGVDGKDGASVSISDKNVDYQSSTSGTTTPSGTWDPNPNPVSGQWLWTRTTIEYTNGTENWTNVSYSVAYIGVDGTAGKSMQIANYGGFKATLSHLKSIQGKTDSWTLQSNFTGQIGDTLLMKCIVTDQDNAIGYMPCTVTSFSGQKITGTNGSFIYGEKGATGSQGYPGVIIDLSSPSIVVPADENGIVDSSVWNNVSCTVTVIQGSTQFTPVTTTPTENCTFKVSAAESTSSLVGFQIENGNTWQCYTTATDTNPATAMLSTVDSVVVKLTITYKDLNGNVVTVTKDVQVTKVKQSKSLTLWFSWSSSETEYKPANASAWVCSNSFIHYNGSLVGDFSSNGYGDVPYMTTWLQSWSEVQAARTDEYKYLWCKTSEDGTPFLFTKVEYETQYAVGDSNTEAPAEDKWSYDMPNIVNAKYIWIRKKIVGSATWGNAVCSSIGVKFTEDMIKVSSGGNGAYLMLAGDQLELKAENIFAKGSIQADTIDLDDLMAADLQITDKTFEDGTKKVGKLRSKGYNQNDYLSGTKAGFYMDNDGYLECTEGHFKNCEIQGTLDNGEVHSDSLWTFNGNLETKSFVSKNVANNPKYWKLSELTSAMTTANSMVDCSGTYGNNAVSKYAKVMDSGCLYTGKGLIDLSFYQTTGVDAAYSSYEQTLSITKSYKTSSKTVSYTNSDAYNLPQKIAIRFYVAGDVFSTGSLFSSTIYADATITIKVDGVIQYTNTTSFQNGNKEFTNIVNVSLPYGSTLTVTVSHTGGDVGNYYVSGHAKVYAELGQSYLRDVGINSLGSWLYYSSAWHKMTNEYESVALSLLGISNHYVCWGDNCYETNAAEATSSGGYSEVSGTVTAGGTTLSPVIVSWNSTGIVFIDANNNRLIINKGTFFETFSFNFSFSASSSYARLAQLIPKTTTTNIGSQDEPWNAIYAKAIYIKVGDEWKQVTIS